MCLQKVNEKLLCEDMMDYNLTPFVSQFITHYALTADSN